MLYILAFLREEKPSIVKLPKSCLLSQTTAAPWGIALLSSYEDATEPSEITKERRVFIQLLGAEGFFLFDFIA